MIINKLKNKLISNIYNVSTHYAIISYSKLSHLTEKNSNDDYEDSREYSDTDEILKINRQVPVPGIQHKLTDEGQWKYSNNDAIINFYETNKKRTEDFEFSNSFGEFDNVLIKEYTCILENCRNIDDVNISTMIHRIIMTYKSTVHKRILLKEHPKFMTLLMLYIQKYMENFSPRHVSTILWAFGQFRSNIFQVNVSEMVSIEEIIKSLLRRISDKDFAKKLNPQDISNSLSGIAKMELNQRTCNKAVNCMIEEAESKMKEFPSISISNMLWSLSQLRYNNINNLCIKIAEESKKRLFQFEPRHITLMLSSFVKLNFIPDIELLNEIQDFYIQDSDTFDLQATSNLIWAFSKIRYRPNDEFMQLFYNYCERNVEDFIPMEVSNIMYALASIAHQPKKSFITSFRNYYNTKMMKFTIQNSCNAIWAFSILNELDFETLKNALDNYFTIETWRKMQMRSKHQICMCIAYAKIFQKKNIYDNLNIYAEILIDLDKFWKISRFNDNNPYYDEMFDIVSKSSEFSKLGIEKSEIGPCSLNTMMRMIRDENFKLKMAIDITNDNRLLLNDKDELVGRRRFVEKAMKKLGLDVIRVNIEDWKEWTLEQKQSYIDSCLYDIDI